MESLIEIARMVRWQLETEYGDLRGLNDIAARSLHAHLKSHGIDCHIVKGTFKTDKDVGLFDLVGPVEHYWISVDDHIVDILADLFNPLLDEPMSQVFIGTNDRYQGELLD